MFARLAITTPKKNITFVISAVLVV